MRKVREGRLLRISRPDYGFKYDETGEGYVVDEAEMRIFRGVSARQTMRGVKNATSSTRCSG